MRFRLRTLLIVLGVGPMVLAAGYFALPKRERERRDYSISGAGEVLKLVITDWMSNPDVKDQPYGYLIDPDDGLASGPQPTLNRLLIDEPTVPKRFDLQIPGVRVALFDRSKQDLQQGEMYISIDRFEQENDGSIEVVFFHTGHGFIGGAMTTYQAKKVRGKWAVNLTSSIDP
jgi:hypothetical protein